MHKSVCKCSETYQFTSFNHYKWPRHTSSSFQLTPSSLSCSILILHPMCLTLLSNPPIHIVLPILLVLANYRSSIATESFMNNSSKLLGTVAIHIIQSLTRHTFFSQIIKRVLQSRSHKGILLCKS